MLEGYDESKNTSNWMGRALSFLIILFWDPWHVSSYRTINYREITSIYDWPVLLQLTEILQLVNVTISTLGGCRLHHAASATEMV